MPEPQADHSRLAESYNKMLEWARHLWPQRREQKRPRFHDVMARLREKLVQAGELTQEEIDRVIGYLQRDIHDAARYIADQERELSDWLRLDALLVERQLLELFSLFVDETRLELDHLKYLADRDGRWRSGEVTGIGTLQCAQCGQMLHFHKTGHIPPCPKCHGTTFRRPHHEGGEA